MPKLSQMKCLMMALLLLAHAPAGATMFSERHYELKTRDFSGFQCADQGEDCYQKAIDYIAPNETSTTYRSYELSSQGSKVTVMGHGKTPLAVLAIHGLYGSSDQFSDEEALLKFLGINVVRLTLPGHGPFAQSYEKVRYEDWQKSAREAFRFTQALGDQVVLMGQSTGGLLSFSLALEDQKHSVAGLILIEPAFRVKTDIQFLSCGLKKVISKAQDVAWLAKLVGHDTSGIEQPISTSMGCEVTRLGAHILDSYAPVSDLQDGEETPAFSYLERYHTLFSIRQMPPTLIGHTGSDDVVDDTVIREFVKVQARNILQNYDASQLNGKTVLHGALTQEHLLGEGKNRVYAYSSDQVKGQPVVKFLFGAFPDKVDYFKSSMDIWVLASDYERFLTDKDRFLVTLKLIDAISKLPTLDQQISALAEHIYRLVFSPFDFSSYDIDACRSQNPSLITECESFIVKGDFLELNRYLRSFWEVVSRDKKLIDANTLGAMPYHATDEIERMENERNPKIKTELQAIQFILDTFRQVSNGEEFKNALATIERTKFATRVEYLAQASTSERTKAEVSDK